MWFHRTGCDGRRASRRPAVRRRATTTPTMATIELVFVRYPRLVRADAPPARARPGIVSNGKRNQPPHLIRATAADRRCVLPKSHSPTPEACFGRRYRLVAGRDRQPGSRCASWLAARFGRCQKFRVRRRRPPVRRTSNPSLF